MINQVELFKGEIMEEKLRMYFLQNGYYVARGVKYNFEGNEITDIDLFLYGRVSSVSRIRTNVDIKNKKSPKTFERILWAKGLQELLRFDNCIVATTDKKDVFRKFGLIHNTIILDGNFLQRLTYDTNVRLSEEDWLSQLNKIISYKTFPNQSWRSLYENSKSRLLDELDFSGYNSTLILLEYFLKNCFNRQKNLTALRASYIILSHSLLILDYILKDIVFLQHEQLNQILSDGFKYGNLGLDGINRTIEMAVKISNSKVSVNEIKKTLEIDELDILKEYFSKAETTKNIFKWSLAFEKLAMHKDLTLPENLDSDLKGALGIMLDFFQINRKSFFENYT